ncbi:cytochrome c biogenesis CcdA family protein [Methanoregula sp.]|uniref:cytochrome c biogenesis CcdA family protein n=1 Tax=Methanoregula sp. TaxID=2052170 RepID=UPI003C7262EA
MAEVSYLVAFLAGIVSFLAPCVLPLVPGFLAYLAGTTVREGAAKRWDIFVASLLFVAGFSLVFSILGVLLNTVLNSVAYSVQLWLSRAGGLIIIFFGLYLTGLIRIGWLEQEHKIAVTGVKSKYLTSFLFGVAFAAGWTPCVGAALGAIIGLAATQPALTFSLLLAYSLGLGLPFIITGLFASRAAAWITRYSHILYYVNIVFGVLLIIVGILIFTQTLALVANLPLLNNFLLGG